MEGIKELFRELIIPAGYEFYTIKDDRVIIMRNTSCGRMKDILRDVSGKIETWDCEIEVVKKKIDKLDFSLKKGDYIMYLGHLKYKFTRENSRIVKCGDIMKINRVTKNGYYPVFRRININGKEVDNFLPFKFNYIRLTEKAVKMYCERGHRIISIE